MEKVILEIEVEGRPDPINAEIPGGPLDAMIAAVHGHAGLEGAFVFERDKDAPAGSEIQSRKALSVVVHRCKQVLVSVQYEHRTISEKFSPSATVFRVLSWAIGKKGFNLDETARAKANLMIPGANEPLPRDAVIGKYVTSTRCGLTLDLTLRDFTNG